MTLNLGYSEKRVDDFLERLDAKEQQQSASEEPLRGPLSEELPPWLDWLLFGIIMIAVSCYATPLGALAMVWSDQGKAANAEFVAEYRAKLERERVRENERIREQVRRGY